MNLQNINKSLKLVLSVGDESGIGPEIILKALYSNEIPENIEYILVGSKKNLQNTYNQILNDIHFDILYDVQNKKKIDFNINYIFQSIA